MARASWIVMLGYFAFVFVTLLGVEDADFFVPSRQTQLPLVNVTIPTQDFFWAASPLGAALYVYLQIILIKLWDAVGDLDSAEVDGYRAAELITPWLANDLALFLRGKPFTPDRPLLYLGLAATISFVWLAGPVALGYAWWRSMPAHDECLTLWLGLWFVLTFCVGAESAFTACQRLIPKPKWRFARYLAPWMRMAAGLVLLIAASLIGWDRTEGGQTLPLAPANLQGVEMVTLPDGWRDIRVARSAYREVWCQREGLEMLVCGQPESSDSLTPDHVQIARRAWCAKNWPKETEVDCKDRFHIIDKIFVEAWKKERTAAIGDLPALKLEARDLRTAIAPAARLEGADLSRSKLEKANFFGARLEGANLFEARLNGANLTRARLEGADLRLARLKGANLQSARLEGADFHDTRLQGANLAGAWLNGIDLTRARLKGANLSYAKLEGADLSGKQFAGVHLIGAKLQGANLIGADLVGINLNWVRLERAFLWDTRALWSDFRWTDFRGAYWEGASIGALLTQFSDFRAGQYLSQAQLEHVIGNDLTLLPDRTNEDRTNERPEPYYVWSCWETPPEGFDAIVATAAGPSADDADRAQLRQEFLCQHRPRRQVGTPLPLDAPYPPGHPFLARTD